MRATVDVDRLHSDLEAIVGPRSVLSLWGPRHKAERRLLSPP